MDPRLYDTLWEVHRSARSQQPLHVVSAYRSPRTNEMLRQRSRGVARSKPATSRAKARPLTCARRPCASRLERETAVIVASRRRRRLLPAGEHALRPHRTSAPCRHWTQMTRSQSLLLFPRWQDRSTALRQQGAGALSTMYAARDLCPRAAPCKATAARPRRERRGRQRSLWWALFGDDEGEANADEAYAALPTNVPDTDQRYALMNAQSATSGAAARFPPGADAGRACARARARPGSAALAHQGCPPRPRRRPPSWMRSPPRSDSHPQPASDQRARPARTATRATSRRASAASIRAWQELRRCVRSKPARVAAAPRRRRRRARRAPTDSRAGTVATACGPPSRAPGLVGPRPTAPSPRRCARRQCFRRSSRSAHGAACADHQHRARRAPASAASPDAPQVASAFAPSPPSGRGPTRPSPVWPARSSSPRRRDACADHDREHCPETMPARAAAEARGAAAPSPSRTPCGRSSPPASIGPAAASTAPRRASASPSASLRDGAPTGLVAIPAAGLASGFSRDAAAPAGAFRIGPPVSGGSQSHNDATYRARRADRTKQQLTREAFTKEDRFPLGVSDQ